MWVKKGLVFNINEFLCSEIVSHASIPFAVHLFENRFRIFFSSRNEKGQSLPYSIDAKVSNGEIELIGGISKPLMVLGDLGTFDDSGIMPSSLVRLGDKLYMYYIGWNPQVTVSYRLSIGLAISHDEGLTFERYSKGPISDRGLSEPFFNTAPFVMRENDLWRMWYISCTSWKIINDHPEPSYHVKYAESLDGINWMKNGIVCIDYDDIAEAIGRPCILKKDDQYEMFFSYRSINEYRLEKGKGYKIGKAESEDGILWTKKYNKTGIDLSEEGWDHLMMEYCHVFRHDNIDYMLYNGNGFGKDGFGYAIRK